MGTDTEGSGATNAKGGEVSVNGDGAGGVGDDVNNQALGAARAEDLHVKSGFGSGLIKGTAGKTGTRTAHGNNRLSSVRVRGRGALVGGGVDERVDAEAVACRKSENVVADRVGGNALGL